MNLYHWSRATCLKAYRTGDIIVMAESVEEARQKVRDNIDEFLKEHRSWWFLGDNLDEYCREEYKDFMGMLEFDITLEPDIVASGAVFITGSE
ncbi:hypothetical protein [Brucella anthropi]|uniref:hypothetical protein n=1 Tax=Brucella anthropi TaxID=529 RepID=UPI00124D08CE|nr:hypothetical protein [Brucella anthropi]KAB2751783.1 hypothetical protein F9L05_01210 [Brucella anthropi]